ncbi:MAG TPA: hypothetical protein DCQ83_02025 [Fibrobacteres bacterium]|jgi:hypothetical protein|nr:hypothetical protein [Fibrobacterota bacterium]
MDPNEDKAKARRAFRLDLLKLFIDKIALGAVVVLFGFLANKWFEKYKFRLSEQRFFMEQRLESIKKIQTAYTVMFHKFDNYTLRGYSRPVDYQARYDSAVDGYTRALDEHGTLLSPQTLERMDYQGWLFQNFKYQDVAAQASYRNFFYDLYREFYLQAKVELGVIPDTARHPVEFDEWSHAKADSLGAQAFFDANFEKWKQRRDAMAGNF